jgi:hypothetical protein
MKEEVAERKATFLDALKGLEATIKNICLFVTANSIIVMCNKVENFRFKKNKPQKTLNEWLKK